VSRGLGVVQRRILEQLKLNTANRDDQDELTGPLWFASWTTVLDLAGAGATRARIESTRRAVLKLAAEGLVETRHVFGRGRERPMRSGRMARYGSPYGLCPVYPGGIGKTSPLLLAARLSVEDAALSSGPQHLTPAQVARFVMTGEMPDAPLSVDDADFSRGTQHLRQATPALGGVK
jgi:hypothetical protein